MSQNMNGLLKTSAGIGYAFFELSEDYETAIVTRAQWEAERARISEDLQMAKHKAGADELERRYAQSFGAKDQALWDKVAIAAISGLTSWKDGPESLAEDAFDIADAFMAERAKRIK